MRAALAWRGVAWPVSAPPGAPRGCRRRWRVQEQGHRRSAREQAPHGGLGSISRRGLRHEYIPSQILHYIPLPSLVVPMLHKGGPPLHVRDINLIGGYIRYFEMRIYFGRHLETTGWEGATSRRKVLLSCADTAEWEEGNRIKVCNDPTSSRVPPNLKKGSVLTEPVLKGRYAGFPAISLHDDDVVYIMDKHEFLDEKASVVAVDMKNQTLRGVADFVSGGILGYTRVYIPSGISKYMGL